MTPEQHEHLRLLKAHLESLLEGASKRTPGEWGADFNCTSLVFAKQERGEFEVATIDDRRDAAFIASCAGNAESGWKSTIGVIEAYYKAGICREWQGYMQSAIEPILAAWPIETLKP